MPSSSWVVRWDRMVMMVSCISQRGGGWREEGACCRGERGGQAQGPGPGGCSLRVSSGSSRKPLSAHLCRPHSHLVSAHAFHRISQNVGIVLTASHY